MRSARRRPARICARCKQLLEYTEVSDVNMEEGSLRVDANVSARPPARRALGTRTEVKNMNSFSNVERALELEFARQCAVLDARRHDRPADDAVGRAQGRSAPARVERGQPRLPLFPGAGSAAARADARVDRRASRRAPGVSRGAKRARFASRATRSADADAEVLTASRAVARLFREGRGAARRREGRRELGDGRSARVVQRAARRRHAIARCTADRLGALLALVRDGALSNTAAKTVFATMLEQGGEPRAIAERDGLLQAARLGALAQWVDEVLAENAGGSRRDSSAARRSCRACSWAS